ncbi:predicted protein [Plenodomus lingam JN3]|uniref:Predicted protein n=1 Tax=Leptosphaeria maculans (strain JN3 / isolate v23.1.3 / race Av1-4-5-6-7-8) TaxID=985895 RepID=E5AFR2_LEPMJ|nr:predicted protein [Plenodomus lingam JN3]CBY02051.1 predicted protein [Plenodomus lingam JN3]
MPPPLNLHVHETMNQPHMPRAPHPTAPHHPIACLLIEMRLAPKGREIRDPHVREICAVCGLAAIMLL